MNNELYHYGVLGMKWGVRRYQNPDGTLIHPKRPRGPAEQFKSIGGSSNNLKGKTDKELSDAIKRKNLENQYNKVYDTDNYNKIKNIKNVVDQSSNIVREADKIFSRSERGKQSVKQQDLSQKSDTELRNEINRYYLEKQYNDIFNSKNESKGRKFVKDIFKYSSDALVFTSSALGIMLAVKQLKHSDYLKHHGILGMKWGQRNGPPYPLGAGDHSKSEQKAGWTKSLGGGVQSGTITSDNSKEQKVSRTEQSSKAKRVDKKTGFNKISKPETTEERLSKINPNFTQSKYVTPYNRNCGNTAIANELRQRGLDVEARGNNLGMTIGGLQSFFEGSEQNTHSIDVNVSPLKGKQLRQALFGQAASNNKVRQQFIERSTIVKSEYTKAINSSCSGDARGAMMITMPFGSHWISWEKKGEQVTFTNPQNPKEDLDLLIGMHFDIPNNKPTIVRLDNLKTKNNINEVVMNSGDTKADSKGMSYNPLKDIQGADRLKKVLGEQWDGTWDYYDSMRGKYHRKV